MMPSDMYSVYDLQKEHRASLLQVAQSARLLRLAKLYQTNGQQPFLSHMGDLLIAWGWWLKQRYEAVQATQASVDTPMMLPTNHFLSSKENAVLHQRHI
ncbi:MAG: hypothetical protein NT075_11005 [Chloroflexi bacterium]|nr:hypothetical protein [Chloroflexota bacterium]